MNSFQPIVSPFFAEKGLTATSADHIANLAKHSYESVLEELENINFVNASVQIIGSDAVMATSVANNDANIESFKEKLSYIAECKAFIAFLREAIKEKERLTTEAEKYVSDELRKFRFPDAPEQLTIEDVLNTLSTKERERYLTLDATAATIGKYIHPSGKFYDARKKAFNAKAKGTDVSYNGRDTIVTSYSIAVPNEKIDEALNSLQKWHRSVEAELNGIKNSIETIIREDYSKRMEEYSKELSKYEAEHIKLIEQDKATKLKRLDEIKKLQIVIPNKFRDLYEKLSKD